MKKKTVKKLVLAKETVRELTSQDLGAAAGGTEVTWGCDTWRKLRLTTTIYCNE